MISVDEGAPYAVPLLKLANIHRCFHGVCVFLKNRRLVQPRRQLKMKFSREPIGPENMTRKSNQKFLKEVNEVTGNEMETTGK